MKKLCLLSGKILPVIFLFLSGRANAQSADSAKIVVSGYVDAYYAFYTDSVGDGNYQKFPSVSPRSNSFGLNTAMLTAQYDGVKARGVVSLQYGDIARCAWSPTFNAILEAHAGIRLCKNNKLWLDAGFFRTHFGTEGLLPKENFCSSVSVNTYFEPYYEAGARLQYTPCDKFTLFVYGLNGYNMYEDNNHKKSIGVLATYALGDKGNIGYSNYIGDDSPTGDTVTHLRIHNNLFWNYAFGKLKLQIGGDLCYQEHSDIATGMKAAIMMSGVCSVKYPMCKYAWIYARGEMFDDRQGLMSGVIVDTKGMLTGLRMFGGTLGVECKPIDNAYIRLEARDLAFDEEQQIFYWNKAARSSRMEVLCNIGISF
ncbi:MAG TPA: outer membrane beta-barrel protein [Bacteroidia bacterium]|jgi:hypothetical protein|nr:outer membrane beta-barrel protein [Bacteroidia bacterium]